MASKEANKVKYQYNKKYVDNYWERRGHREGSHTYSPATRETVGKDTVILSIFMQDFPTPKLDEEDMTVSRHGKSDERYITALEIANKRLNSENKRLIRMMRKQQEIIRQSVAGLYHES